MLKQTQHFPFLTSSESVFFLNPIRQQSRQKTERERERESGREGVREMRSVATE